MSEFPRIREAVEADARAVQRYIGAIRRERLPFLYDRDEVPGVDDQRDLICKYRDSANSVIFIAEEAEKVVGMVDLLGHPLAQCTHTGQIGLSVGREWRSRGVGTALLDATLEWAARNGLLRVELEVFSNNADAIALYKKKGFVHEGRRHGAAVVDNEFVDILIMARCAAEILGSCSTREG